MSGGYFCNDQALDAEAFYRIACDPQRSVVVEACAGAGKTWILVARMLRALLDGARPQEILAITFTRKAAAEMQQRLDELLRQCHAAGEAERVQMLQSRGLDRSSAQQLAPALHGLLRRVLQESGGVEVHTFHGWFATLLRQAPLAFFEVLGLPADFELLEDEDEARLRLWPAFLQAVAADASLQEDFGALVAEHGRHMAFKALREALARRIEFRMADATGTLAPSVRPVADLFPDLAAFAEPTLALWQGWRAESLRAAAQAMGQWTPAWARRGEELAQALDAQDADGVRRALFTKEGEPRKLPKNAPLEQTQPVSHAQQMVQDIGRAEQQHRAWLHHHRMIALTRCLLQEFARVKRQHGWIDMADLEWAAWRLLSDPVASGWVQERLDRQVRHLLIDEFQDTNPMQWQALSSWLSSYAGAGSRPSLFIVGDPKQSIYRFRRAEPQVFLAAQRFVTDAMGGVRLACDHTRRCAPGLLEGINPVLARLHTLPDCEGFRPHTTQSQESGAVLCLPKVERGDELGTGQEEIAGWRPSLQQPRHDPQQSWAERECIQAARWLAQRLSQGDLTPGDVLVLSRTRDRLNLMDQALRDLRVPSCQPEQDRLADMPEVADVLALLEVLLSPIHDLSLARALKSPIFGLGDDVLLALAQRQRAQPHRSWFDLLQDEEHSTPVPPGLGARLRIWAEWFRQLPPHDALSRIFEAGDIAARFLAAVPATRRAAVLANLQALLHTALNLGGGRLLTPHAFVRALRTPGRGPKAPVRETPGAIRLLTIHGAKGLEAPLVLWLDTDAAHAKAATMPVLVVWPGEAAAPQRFAFLSSEKRPPLCCAQALEDDRRARAREDINALYVAMTRAERTLVLSAHEAHQPPEHSPWRWLQPHALAVEAVPGALQSTPTPDALTDALVLPGLGAPLAEGRTGSGAARGPQAAPSPAAPDAARIGQAMHLMLQWFEPGSGWHAGLRQAAGRALELDGAALDAAERMARCILQGKGSWAWDASQLAWQGNEVPLVSGAMPLRADRVVQLRDGTWWVLDYKSAAAPERSPELVQQLLRYRHALQRGLPDALVRCAFLTGAGDLVECADPPPDRPDAPAQNVAL